jgi:hypothetical protein
MFSLEEMDDEARASVLIVVKKRILKSNDAASSAKLGDAVKQALSANSADLQV